jgi:enoyl-CoA hydratase/carnithine racemase
MLQAPANGRRITMRPTSERPESGVRVEDAGAIRKLILDRPSKKNAITRAMYGTLTEALFEATQSATTDVVLLTSAGGAFSVGTDYGDFGEGEPNSPEGQDFARIAGTFFRALASFPKPIVAAVGGAAVGSGATLLLHCDLIVAARTAVFEFPFTKAGIVPDGGASVLLAARVGFARASEWLLYNDRIDVDTALRLGLVNAIAHREELEGVALARAEALAKLPQRAVRETKRLLREPHRIAVDEAITRELDAISPHLPLPEVAVVSSGFFPRSW